MFGDARFLNRKEARAGPRCLGVVTLGPRSRVFETDSKVIALNVATLELEEVKTVRKESEAHALVPAHFAFEEESQLLGDIRRQQSLSLISAHAATVVNDLHFVQHQIEANS